MSLYSRLAFPLLSKLDPEKVHDWTLNRLEQAQSSAVGRSLLRAIAGRIPPASTSVCGLAFPNPIGIAAGFDKNARVIPALGALGFGHVEIGTITPRSQSGNPQPRIFRLPDQKAVLNRMGFPNEGVTTIAHRLASDPVRRTRIIVGASLGKQKETPVEEAAQDYVYIMRHVISHVDYLAINISSPNTPGLRELQSASYLDQLLKEIVSEKKALEDKQEVAPVPLFLKISPDLQWDEIDAILDAFDRNGCDGVIATNTTVARPGMEGAWLIEPGGLSGKPLAARSTEIIAYLSRSLKNSRPIIGVGGVFNATDVQEKIDAGASLVQIYTGLVYEGPGLAGRILREMNG